MALATAGFSWDHIKFKNQYFKKEDYLSLSSNKAHFATPELDAERLLVRNKLLQLHELIKHHLHTRKLHEAEGPSSIVSSLDPAHHVNGQLRSLWLTYGRSAAELQKVSSLATVEDGMHIRVVLGQADLGISLVVGKPRAGKADREYFNKKMNDAEYRDQFFELMTKLGEGYWIEIACERKAVETFSTQEALWEFTNADEWLHYAFILEKKYSPDAKELSTENIAPTMMNEIDKLVLLIQHMTAWGMFVLII